MKFGAPRNPTQTLSFLAALFIACYFFLFTSDSLSAWFTFDDGMNLISLHHLWTVPLSSNILDVLKVFTPAYRPLGAMFYRPLYYFFGFQPLPFRIVCYLLLMTNVVLAYRLARAVDATGEVCALSTLLFCYNGSMIDLYFNTGTIYDLLCFLLYMGSLLAYIRRRSKRLPLNVPTVLIVMVLFLAALDAKEMAVTLPAVLLLYELLYCFQDLKSPRTFLPTGSLLLLMFAASFVFFKVKAAELSGNTLYHPHLSLPFVLSGMGHYFEQLLYLTPESFGPAKVAIAFAAPLAAAALLRSRVIAFGTLFFATGLLPLSVIDHRTGYAAYVAYPGLTLALAASLASARSALTRFFKKEDFELAGIVTLFVMVAAISIAGFARTTRILVKNARWDEQRRIDFLTGLKQQIPEFPPNARILLLDDPWEGGWGPMFLAQLMYHDPSLWIDRLKNAEQTGDRESYDLLVRYEQPRLDMRTPRIFGMRKRWEPLWFPIRKGVFTLTAPDENRAMRSVQLSPGQPFTLTVTGLANVRIDAMDRTPRYVEGVCLLDAKGSCTIPAPLTIDWVRPSKGRWIFTRPFV